MDDRSTKARIRDAAIETFAEFGPAATTARKVATRAGVSAGSVINHFGSMDGLREACDAHVAALFRADRQDAITQGGPFDPLASLRESKAPATAGYLASVLVDDSPIVARLVDELVADARSYLKEGEEAGTVRPSDHTDERAAILTLWSLGSLVLHRHFERLLGVDLASPASADDEALTRYLAAAYEVVSPGIFTDAFASTVRESLSKVRS